ncbi:MAG TPA: hypothetical protein VFA11_11500 [Acidimicrobiales bacterium]|nr:hypothetical protein [Acidimicrobiales bacterium]
MAGPTELVTVAGAVCTGPSATSTALAPMGVLWDGSGGFYVSVYDKVHSEVCHVDASGHISVAAGNGTPGYLPTGWADGVAATSSEIYNPVGLSLSGGNLYIADSWNGRVRMVDSTGVISSVAAGLSRPVAVVPDGSGGFYVADELRNQVLDVSSSGSVAVTAGTGVGGFGGDNGPASQALLNRPEGLALVNGTLYISDSNNNRIRAVDTTGTIRTVAGTGAAGYSGDQGLATAATLHAPLGLAADASGDLFMADSENAAVREVSSAGVISTVAGTGQKGYTGDGGPATGAELYWPTGVSVDPSGDLLIADGGSARVRQVVNGIISTVAGNGSVGMSGDGGPAVNASLAEPVGVAVGSSGVDVVDSQNGVIRHISTTGTITTLAGPAGGYTFPIADLFDSKGNLYVADWGNRIFEVMAGTGQVRVVAGTGTAGYTGDGGPATGAELNQPSGLALDSHSNLYISDSGNNVVRMVSPTGKISTYAGDGFPTSSTNPLGDGQKARAASFHFPYGLLWTSNGLYVSDRDNQRIRLVSSGGVVSTVAGTGVVGWTPDGTSVTSAAFNYPAGLALTADGRLLVADDGNCVVRVIAYGLVSTDAGWGPAKGVTPTCGYIGANGDEVLNHPLALATASTGTVYVADSLNNRVRSFTP